MIIEQTGNQQTVSMTVLEALELQTRLNLLISHALKYKSASDSVGAPIVINGKTIPCVVSYVVTS